MLKPSMRDKLFNKKATIDDHNQSMVLGQYLAYIDGLLKATDRRQNMLNYYLVINTAVLYSIGTFTAQPNTARIDMILYLLIIFGVTNSLLFIKLINKYKHLSNTKYDIIYEIEKDLPLQPYTQEGKNIKGKGYKYQSFSRAEQYIPGFFLLMYTALTIVFAIL